MSDKQYGSSSERYSSRADASALKVRLDTDYVLERVRICLSGEISSVVYDDKGKPYIQSRIIAKKMCNNDGMQWLQNYVENIINSQTVQGNFTLEQYENYIAEVHDGLILNVMNNLNNWEISEDDYENIIDTIMNLVQPFISRLIDNKERGSYAETMAIKESNVIQQDIGKKGLFSKLGGGD